MSILTERYADSIEKQKNGISQGLIYYFNDVEFIIPLSFIQDIIEPVEVKTVPGASDIFNGIFAFDSKPYYLVNLAMKMDIKLSRINNFILTNIQNSEGLAFTVSSISDAVSIQDLYQNAVIPAGDFNGIPTKFIKNIFKTEINSIIELDLARILH